MISHLLGSVASSVLISSISSSDMTATFQSAYAVIGEAAMRENAVHAKSQSAHAVVGEPVMRANAVYGKTQTLFVLLGNTVRQDTTLATAQRLYAVIGA